MLAVLVAMVVGVGCVSTPVVVPGDNSSMFVSNAELQLEKAAWLKPIADQVMLIFCEGKTNQACMYYTIISKGAGVAIEIAKVAIVAYKKDPSALNLADLKASMDQLNFAILGLDAGYKGKI